MYVLSVIYVMCACVEGEFGEGVEVIWLDDIVCGGEEKRLADCQHAGWAEHNCVPSENAGVHCARKLSVY